HDALFLARVAPAVMIFVPCRDGLSHNEAEYVEPAYAVTGARVLQRGGICGACPRGYRRAGSAASGHRRRLLGSDGGTGVPA
ncbi:M20/M25/M40 family metallo-hydrolase, partial [Mesorhizobium sp. M0133]